MDVKRAGRRGWYAGLAGVAALVGCGGDGGAAADAAVDAPQIGTLLNQGSTEMEDVRVQEDGVANFITDTLLTDLRARTGEPIDLALLQGGALRGGTTSGPPDYVWSSETARVGNMYGPGPITQADIEGWLPFPHDTAILTVTGAQLKRVLEHGVNRFADDAQTSFGADLLNDKGGEFLHAAGLAFTATCAGTTRLRIGPTGCDPTAGACHYLNPADASTITRIAVGGSVIYDTASGGWQGGAETAPLRVVTSVFLANGGDGHLDLRDGTDREDILGTAWRLQDAITERFRSMSPVTLVNDEARITVAGTVRGLPCNLPESCTPSHLATHANCAHLR